MTIPIKKNKILNESEKINNIKNLEKNPHSSISKIKSRIKKNQKRETLYFNFDKNNISLTKKEEYKNQDFNLDNNDNDIVEFKRKKLIMLKISIAMKLLSIIRMFYTLHQKNY